MSKTSGTTRSHWELQIEFTGLMVAEPFCKQHKLIVHLIDNSMHVPALTARVRDVKESRNCAPAQTVFVGGNTSKDAHTLGIWPIRRGAMMGLFPPRESYDLHIPHAPIVPKKCSNSVYQLANLNKVLSATRCVPNSDDVRFMLTHGSVSAGRCDPKLIFEITGGPIPYEGPLALSLIYTLRLPAGQSATIDLHPGKVEVCPPVQSAPSYVVYVGVSNLPISLLTSDDPPHFMEYNRLVGKNVEVKIKIKSGGSPAVPVYVEYFDDPIHCVPGALIQEA